MKRYKLELSENGWEYTGHISITANKVIKVDNNIIDVGGAIIEFDEEIEIVSEEEV